MFKISPEQEKTHQQKTGRPPTYSIEIIFLAAILKLHFRVSNRTLKLKTDIYTELLRDL